MESHGHLKIILPLYVLMSQFAAVPSGLCPDLYLRYSQQHTFCLDNSPSCTILKTSIPYDDKAFIVAEHNDLRSKVAMGEESIGPLSTAANMLQMVWDDDLEAVAQKHANQCKMQHDCNDCRKMKNFNVGQNLYEYEIVSSFWPTPNWTAAIHSWYNEVKDFDVAIVPFYDARKTSGEYGHFTQLIWASTWRIGCGYTLYLDGTAYHQQYTCNYGPSGNIKEQSVYEYGAPCSRCPLNACCGDSCFLANRVLDYPGLCKLLYDEEPQLSNTREYILQCNFKHDSECPVQTPPEMKQWEIFDSLSGSYIGVVLEGGENTVLNFQKILQAKTTMCVTLLYRKGPNIAGNEVENRVLENFLIMNTGQIIQAPLNENLNVFSKFSMSLNWNQETQFSIEFSVPPGKPAQFLEIKDVFVTNGDC